MVERGRAEVAASRASDRARTCELCFILNQPEGRQIALAIFLSRLYLLQTGMHAFLIDSDRNGSASFRHHCLFQNPLMFVAMRVPADKLPQDDGWLFQEGGRVRVLSIEMLLPVPHIFIKLHSKGTIVFSVWGSLYLLGTVKENASGR